ncbi:MAG: hypothetical protein ATN31_02160 [Candidatus Epulonipiscioides saccharophilum]|nr:MAG: hypothetical protein ATN31_02160 [Epulopiscium sp. AS2M-Bin001]
MKLRQKLAMLMAATMITTTFPTLTSAITKSAVATQALVMYSTSNYVHPTTTNTTHSDEKAININISNNDSMVIDGRKTPQQFHLKGIDIKFSNSIFTPTKGAYCLPGPAKKDGQSSNDFEAERLSEYIIDSESGESLSPHTPYGLVDYSKNNSYLGNAGDDGRITTTQDYADRIFVIDKDGNYTSYVSMRYAAIKDKVEYVSLGRKATNVIFEKNTTQDIEEAYLFQKIVSDNDEGDYKKEIYINKIPNEDNTALELNHKLDIVPFNPIKTMASTPAGQTGVIDETANLLGYTVTTGDGTTAEVYLKEFTLFRDTYGSDTLLDGEFYQLLQRNFDNADLYIPIAFSLTGKAPFIEIMGSEFTYAKLKLQSRIITDLVDYKLKREGQLSTNAKGDLGIFEIAENKLKVFEGTFDGSATDLESETELQNGSDGVFLFELDNDDLNFDLKAGDRLWNKELDGQSTAEEIIDARGRLFDYIQFASGLRGFEEFIQVEVLAVQDNNMVVRITDQSVNRKHEGGVEFCQLPIDVNRKTTLSLGDIKISITQINPETLEYKAKGGRVDDLDFYDANTVEETFVIAEVRDENIRIEALEEANVLTGQDSSTVEIALRELVDDTLDIRDEFYMKIENGIMSTPLENIWFYLDGVPIQNKADYRIFEKDDNEYILDIDHLYDAWIDMENYDEDDDTDLDTIKREWERILDLITFSFDVRADLNGSVGDIKLSVESQNFKNNIEEIIIGDVKKSFTYTAPPVSVDLGIKEQKTGTITFKETQPEMFQDGSQIVINLEDIGMDSRSVYTASVKTDGQSGLEVASPKFDDGNLIITISEESDDIPGTITIENMQYDIWAGTPRGAYDLQIGGSALDHTNTSEKPFEKKIQVNDYLNVGVNLVSSVEVITAQINFNSGTTVVNGQTQRPMTPPMMLNGWAMIGIRDIAAFFGIPQDKIAAFHDEHGVMTITVVNGTIGETGSTLVTVRNGSKILTVNGTPVIMGQPMTISDDNHAYVPIRPIAEALGLHVYWNDATRVATVSTAFIQ